MLTMARCSCNDDHMSILHIPTWAEFIQHCVMFLHTILLYPLGDGLLNHLALVGALCAVLLMVARVSSTFGTAPDL